MTQLLRLYVGKRFTGIIIARDGKYPEMWRIRLPDGTFSDMLNITRAKDAALALAAKGQSTGSLIPIWKAT